MLRPWFAGLLQAFLLATALSPRDDLLVRPIRNVDYTSHFYSANHFAEHFSNTLSFWGYDPFWMAGYPEGFVGLVDNKLFALLVSAAPAGFEAGVFNAAVLLAIVCVPWVLAGAARMAGGTGAEAGGAALSGVVLTFGAPVTTFFWVAGAVSFLLSSVVATVAALALATSVSHSSLVSRRGGVGAALAFVAVYAHPLAVLPLVTALAVVPITSRRPPRRVALELAVIAAIIALPLLPVVEGIAANLGQARPADPRAELLRGGLGQLARDWWLYLLRTDEHSRHGAGSLAAVVVAALFARFAARAPTDAETAARRATTAVILVCGALAYLASSLDDRLANLQPYRFLIPLGFFAAVPAGRGLVLAVDGVRRRRVFSSVVALLFAAFAVEGVWSLRHVRVLGHGVDPAEEAIPAFLAQSDRNDGRVLVESDLFRTPVAPASGRHVLLIRFALLPLTIDREFLGNVRTGPFTAERYAAFADGRILGRRVESVDAADLRKLLALHAVSTVVACSPAALATLARFPEVVEPRAELADCRGFEVRGAETSRVLEGSAQVSARLDRIRVRDARGARLVLKYHWIPALRTSPPLPIEEARQPGSPVGFIAVRPGGVEDFDILLAPWTEIGASLGSVVGKTP